MGTGKETGYEHGAQGREGDANMRLYNNLVITFFRIRQNGIRSHEFRNTSSAFIPE